MRASVRAADPHTNHNRSETISAYGFINAAPIKYEVVLVATEGVNNQAAARSRFYWDGRFTTSIAVNLST